MKPFMSSRRVPVSYSSRNAGKAAMSIKSHFFEVPAIAALPLRSATMTVVEPSPVGRRFVQPNDIDRPPGDPSRRA
eukprot:3494865-Prymnesium_polylepis.1